MTSKNSTPKSSYKTCSDSKGTNNLLEKTVPVEESGEWRKSLNSATHHFINKNPSSHFSNTTSNHAQNLSLSHLSMDELQL
ncbi:6912_t:CDS:2 [Funneliformis geosporum]|nr:6912_t:CDS:2 [Funneliformis geosporum]